jgi:hypothetical protein
MLHLTSMSPMPAMKLEPGAGRCTDLGLNLGLHSVIQQPMSLTTGHHHHQMVRPAPGQPTLLLPQSLVGPGHHHVTQHLQILHPAPPLSPIASINSVPRCHATPLCRQCIVDNIRLTLSLPPAWSTRT